MTNRDIIQQAITYIEENIKQALSAEVVAEHAGYSIYYFHRLFSAYTGFSLVGYIRQRKMAHAKNELISGRRLLDIALDYGYSSERAFSRAFIAQYGQTPGKSRNGPSELPQLPTIYDLTVSKTIGGKIMNYLSEIRYTSLKDMTVASHTIISNNPEEEVVEYLQKWMQSKGIPNTAPSYGFDSPVTAEQEKEGLRGYEYWVVVEESDEDKQVVYKEIPGYDYVTLRIEDPFDNPFERIPNGWKALVKWLDEHEIRQNIIQSPCLEQVLEVKGMTYMDIMIPIKR